jgi:hypothetical protein
VGALGRPMADLTLKSKVTSPTIDYGGAVVLEEWPFLMWGLDWVISCPIDTFLSTYYTTGMKQTMLLKLAPTTQQHQALLETLHTFNAAQVQALAL